MGRRWIAALAIAATTTLYLAPSHAESKWHLPKPQLWPHRDTDAKPKKSKNVAKQSVRSRDVEPASAWSSFTEKPTQAAKAVASAPVNLAKRAGEGTKQLYGNTRNLVTAPFRPDTDVQPKRKTTRTKAKNDSKPFFSNPFSSGTASKKKSGSTKKRSSSSEPSTVSEFLKLDRPGIDE